MDCRCSKRRSSWLRARPQRETSSVAASSNGLGCCLGVNLRDLFPQHPVPEGWYHGKRIAVDGHNVAFRYLTSFRDHRTGEVLKNADGRVTAHLIGFSNLVRHLRERGAEPIIIWDGAVHPRKWATVEGRIANRLEAAFKAEEALAAGDATAHQKYLRATTYLDGKMIQDCTRMLEAVGVSVIDAPHDGERFAAAMCHAGHADAVATEDFDALVAGAPVVLRKAGSAEPFLHYHSDLVAQGLTGAQLRHIAILCGTDFPHGVDVENKPLFGVKGFGAKTGVKMIKEHLEVRTVVADAETGKGDTRYHRLVRESHLTLAAFDEIDHFLADLPKPDAPVKKKPDPATATGVATELGLTPKRLLDCFC